MRNVHATSDPTDLRSVRPESAVSHAAADILSHIRSLFRPEAPMGNSTDLFP